MRVILLLASTMGIGAVGVTHGVIPLPLQMEQAVRALGGDPAQIRNINVNPVEAYNKVLPEILKGRTPDELGFHGTPVTIPPGSFRTMNGAAVNPNGIGRNGFSSNIASQIQQNNNRMQDMSNYIRNPAGWHGMPPH